MIEKRINLQRYAMNFGTYMGLYWIVKFAFFPSALTSPMVMLLFLGMTIAVPFIGYYFTRSFRDKVCGGEITFLQSWVFMIFMYLFAALLVAVAHYIYFRYIDNGHVLDTCAATIKESGIENMPGFEKYAEAQNETIRLMRSRSAIEIAMQMLSQNMIFCTIISLITAPFVMKKKNTIS